MMGGLGGYRVRLACGTGPCCACGQGSASVGSKLGGHTLVGGMTTLDDLGSPRVCVCV